MNMLSSAAKLVLFFFLTCWGSAFAQTANYEWQGSLIDIRATHFVSATKGWAVGVKGTILTTSDGGVTWTAQSVRGESDFNDIHFISPTHGWVVSLYGMYYTTNGGITWQQTSGGQGNAMSFISPMQGWAVSNAGYVQTTTDGGVTWNTLNAGITPLNLKSVHFSSSTQGWTVGDNGIILKTSDGGTTWSQQSSGTPHTLNHVFFISPTQGWAVGNNGTIITTTNGGATWTPQTSQTMQNLNHAYFASATQGWAVGDNGVIMTTTDGGTTWALQALPIANNLYDLSFVSPTQAWIVGANGTIINTTNGGSTWSVQKKGTVTSNQLNSVYFKTATTGWAVGNTGTILATTNGGNTWTAQYSGTSQNLKSVYFVSTTRGWAVGGGGVILRTTNGGNTWIPQNSKTTKQLNGVYFTSTNVGCIVGDNGTIITTTNGGGAWTGRVSDILENINSVHFVSSTRGFVAGNYSRILMTTDGGITWTPTMVSQPFTTLTSIYFVSPSQGIAVGDGVRTTSVVNAGNESGYYWASMSSASSQRCVYFTSPTNGITVGADGNILATTDGGSSWLSQASGTNNDLYGVHFVSATQGWAVGAKGTILTTNNGGATWKPQPSNVTNQLNTVCFTSKTNGIAMGINGLVRITADGGNTWTTQPTAVDWRVANSYFSTYLTSDINGSHFISASKGWAVGNHGIIRTTSDGGMTWTSQSSLLFYKHLQDVYFASATHGWAVGENATIMATTDGGTTWFKQESGMPYQDVNIASRLNSVFFISPTQGWIVSADGSILTTVNGGDTWTRRSSGMSESLLGVYFISPTHGWAVGTTESIFSTVDGGITWTYKRGGAYQTLNDVRFISPTQGWAVGTKGTILSTIDGGKNWERVSHTGEEWSSIAINDGTGYIVGKMGGGVKFDASPRLLRITGNVFVDTNNNMSKELGEKNLTSFVVKASPGDYYTMTDANGNYQLALLSTGTYQVELLPQSPVGASNLITAVCPPKTVAITTGASTITNADLWANGKACSQLSVNVSINRFRRCFEGDTYITYKNAGLFTANNVTITVELPTDIQAISSVPAWTSQIGNTLTYNLSQIDGLSEGTITLKHLVVCGNEAIRGQERCIKATISPANYCTPIISPTWDNADLIANSTCLANRMGRFIIKNKGTGNMTDSTNYRIFYNDVIVQAGKVKLLANQETMIDINNTLEVVRIEVEQTPQHPTGLPAMAFFNRCGNIPTSATSNQALPNLHSIATGSACETIRDSYDPNDKRIMPAGVTAQKIVEKDQELEFQVRFQNTGNDVAYKVVVRDTLDSNLDIASIRTLATSHNNTVSMEGVGQGIVIWTFDNINLPAKSVDEAGSIGMITFRIRMKPSLPIGTEIKNKAGIYFDFNSPIITNQASVKIGTLPTDFGNPANANTIFPCPASPSVAVAGSNQTISTTSTTLAATPIIKGYGKWSVVQGTATFTDEFSPTSTVSGLSFGLNILKWTSHLCNNTSTSEVRIQVQLTNSFTPTSGGIDTRITITGANFTPNSTVTINGQPVRRLWYYSANKIVVQVGDSTTTGKIKIDGVETTTDFTVIGCNAPTNVYATPGTGSNTTITVNWTNAASVNRVDILYRKSGTTFPVTEFTRINTGITTLGQAPQTYVMVGLESNTSYDIFVQTRCDATTWSNWVFAGTITSNTGNNCSRPHIISPTNNSTLTDLQTNLRWSEVANATDYQVFTVEVDAGLQPVGGTSQLISTTSTTAIVNFPKPSTKYRVFVRANCGAIGMGEYSDNFYLMTGAATACLPPDTFSTVNYTTGTNGLADASLSWNGASGAWGTPQYSVHLALPDGNTILSRQTDSNTLTWSGLNGNQTYQYSVRTLCANSNASIFSPWQSFTVPALYGNCGTAITSLNVSHTKPWGAQLNWLPDNTGTNSPANNGRSYWVQYWNVTNPSTIYTIVQDSSKIQLLTNVHQGLVAGQEYACRVWYLCNGNLQAHSSTQTFQLVTSMIDKQAMPLLVTTKGEEMGLLIYPNPAQNTVTINYTPITNTSQPIDLVVIDALGREIYRELSSHQNLRTHLNISLLVAGVYLVKIQHGEHTTTQRLVVE